MPENAYNHAMKRLKHRIALCFALLVAVLGQTPAYACSVKMSSIPSYVVLGILGLNLLAWASLPVALILWRVKKLKARYTVLPSLLANLVLYAALIYLHGEMRGPSEAMAQCAEMQREGMRWIGSGGGG